MSDNNEAGHMKRYMALFEEETPLKGKNGIAMDNVEQIMTWRNSIDFQRGRTKPHTPSANYTNQKESVSPVENLTYNNDIVDGLPSAPLDPSMTHQPSKPSTITETYDGSVQSFCSTSGFLTQGTEAEVPNPMVPAASSTFTNSIQDSTYATDCISSNKSRTFEKPSANHRETCNSTQQTIALPGVQNSQPTSSASAKQPQSPALLDATDDIEFSLHGMWKYFVSELSWGTTRKASIASNEQVVNMLKTPLYFEQFMVVATLTCLDLFLHNLTLLPLRFLYSCGSVLASCFVPARKTLVRRAVMYDLVRGLTIVLAAWVLMFLQISRVYHYIRGEAIIKLYVIFNILEVFDKLMASFGQDVLDGLYRSTVQHASAKSIWLLIRRPWALATLGLHVSLAAIYVVIHSLLQFVQIVCINVAVNSRSNSLLTLLISNNFVELKSSVFKRFTPENLFQVSASDAVERFQIALFLILILLQDAYSFESVLSMLPTVVMMWGAECLVDWVKHCFIGKFNRMHVHVYSKFTTLIAYDTLTTRKTLSACLDPTHLRGRRLGIATLPLTCVLIRLVSIKLDHAKIPMMSSKGIILLSVVFCLLLLLKVSISFTLLMFSKWWLRSTYPAFQTDPSLDYSRKLNDVIPKDVPDNKHEKTNLPATTSTESELVDASRVENIESTAHSSELRQRKKSNNTEQQGSVSAVCTMKETQTFWAHPTASQRNRHKDDRDKLPVLDPATLLHNESPWQGDTEDVLERVGRISRYTLQGGRVPT